MSCDCDTLKVVTVDADEVVKVVEQGPQGPVGEGVPSGGLTKQVLRKKSGADYDTEWATGEGGGVSSWNDLTDKPSTFAPSAHKSSHATGGTDALAPSDIGAQSIFTSEQLTLTSTAQVTLSAARAKVLTIVQYAGGNVDVIMPQSGYIDGDVFVFKWGTGSNSVVVREVAAGSPITTISAGQQRRVQRISPGGWVEVLVDTHTHTPSDVGLGNVSNTAQVTSVSGTAPIVSSGGTTPAISISAATTSAAGSMSASDKTKLDGIASGAEVNVQADWNQSNNASDDFIKNKPSLAAIATSGSASDLGSGTVPIARLGASGTPSGSTYLAGDNSWKSVTGGVSAMQSIAVGFVLN